MGTTSSGLLQSLPPQNCTVCDMTECYQQADIYFKNLDCVCLCKFFVHNITALWGLLAVVGQGKGVGGQVGDGGGGWDDGWGAGRVGGHGGFRDGCQGGSLGDGLAEV